MPKLQPLRSWLAENLSEKAGLWFGDALGTVAESPDKILGLYAAAGRRLGKDVLPTDAPRLGPDDGPMPTGGWTHACAGRVCLLYAAAKAEPEKVEERIRTCYEEGTNEERIAALRTLPFVDEREALLPIAIDATRHNVVDLFAAIAIGNPYPARYFEELNFNQLVLKAVFLDLRLGGMVGLDRRLNPELSRMANEYADERQAAGRSMTPDLWPLVGAFPPDGALPRVLALLESDDPEERRLAALGVGHSGETEHLETLRARLESESEPAVKAALEMAVAELVR